MVLILEALEAEMRRPLGVHGQIELTAKRPRHHVVSSPLVRSVGNRHAAPQLKWRRRRPDGVPQCGVVVHDIGEMNSPARIYGNPDVVSRFVSAIWNVGSPIKGH